MKLWPFQGELIKAYDACDAKRILLVLPTGGGKTVVAARIIKRAVAAGERVLFAAHTREIVQQTHDKLRRDGLRARDVGFILSGDERVLPGAPVQVASIQTLARRDWPEGVTLVFIDEAHHAIADSYQALQQAYPQARIVGLTATPERGDGRGLSDAFDVMLVGATTLDLIAHEFLAKPKCWSVPDALKPDLKGVRVSKGDYEPGQLTRRVTRRAIVGGLVPHYKKHGGGKTAVAYAVSREHARKIAKVFKRAGYDVELLFGRGETSLEERERILARLQRGEGVIVVTVGVLAEGWDCPAAKCCILARPTRSRALFLQQVGRFLRPHASQPPIVLDHAGNVREHGLPEMPHAWRLVMPRRERKGSAPSKECPECGACCATGTAACPECAHEFPIAREPERKKGELVAVAPDPAQVAEVLARFRKLAKSRKAPSAIRERIKRGTFVGVGTKSLMPRRPAGNRARDMAAKWGVSVTTAAWRLWKGDVSGRPLRAPIKCVVDGESLTIREMSLRSGVGIEAIRRRLKSGMSPQDSMVISLINKNRKTVIVDGVVLNMRDMCLLSGHSASAISNRLLRGDSPERAMHPGKRSRWRDVPK